MSTCIIDGSPILVTAELIKALNHKANDAILLQQVWFWQQASRNERDGHTWVYNSLDAWAEKTGLTSRQVRYSVDRLKDLGLLVACQPGRFDRTTWYRVNRDHPLLNPPKPPAQTAPIHLTKPGGSELTETAGVSSTERTRESTSPHGDGRTAMNERKAEPEGQEQTHPEAWTESLFEVNQEEDEDEGLRAKGKSKSKAPRSADSEPFDRRLANELRTVHGCEFHQQPTLHEAYHDLLVQALERLPEDRHHGVAMGVIASFVQAAQGFGLTAEARAHTARLVRTRPPVKVLAAYGEALLWGAGCGEKYANDPLSLSKYVASVLSKQKAGVA